MSRSAVPASGPETRTTAIADGGRPDDRAKMVCSRGCIAYLSYRASMTQRKSDNIGEPHVSSVPASHIRRRTLRYESCRNRRRPSREPSRAETSPYLLQHQHNPVDWWPWGPEALAEAQRTNRPILLSIGYAACHWCHVMAHESFEDDETAAVMNELFVCIKVDREERPDIDQIYMSALHHLGEQGGWPLTMFLTPDGAPFWGGTYFPKLPDYGRPAFTDVLQSVARVFRDAARQDRAEPRRADRAARRTRDGGKLRPTSASPNSITRPPRSRVRPIR